MDKTRSAHGTSPILAFVIFLVAGLLPACAGAGDSGREAPEPSEGPSSGAAPVPPPPSPPPAAPLATPPPAMTPSPAPAPTMPPAGMSMMDPPISPSPPVVGSPVSPVPGDDTFAELSVPGALIKLEGNYGYKDYTLLKWDETTKIDARGAIWEAFMHCTSVAVCPTMTKNNYPIQLGADWGGPKPNRIDLYNYGLCPEPQKEKLYWFGGAIVGTAPLDISWHDSKHSNGAGITINSIGHVLDGIRMHNLHDPYVPLEGNDFVLKNSWITHSRDDAIENDAFAEGVIDDNYIEGFYYVYSATNSGNTTNQPKFGEAAVAPGSSCEGKVRFTNNLIAFKAMSGYGGSAWGSGLWKDWDRAPVPCGKRNPKVDFMNNIVYIPPGRRGGCGLQPRWPGEVKDNIVVDMQGCAGGASGYKVVSGAEGEALWKKAVADWKKNHPLVARIKGTDDDYDDWVANMKKLGGE